jgi:hypothetical protein
MAEERKPENIISSPDTEQDARVAATQSKLDQLSQRLLTLEAERRTLLLTLKNELSLSQSPDTTSPEPTTSQSSPEYTPSTHAHSQPSTPLVPVVEAELMDHAHGTIKKHIKLLHRYNETRDVGQGLIGMVAENRKVRVRDVQEEFGVRDGD